MKNYTKAVSEELRRIVEERGGRITPSQLVEEAKNNATLRDYFTWDDTEAAMKWRIEEAKRMLRFTVEVIGGSKDPVRVMVSLSTERGNGYRLVSDVVAMKDLRAQMVSDALSDMKSFQDRYRRITELRPVFSAMNKAEKNMASQKRRMTSKTKRIRAMAQPKHVEGQRARA